MTRRVLASAAGLSESGCTHRLAFNPYFQKILQRQPVLRCIVVMTKATVAVGSCVLYHDDEIHASPQDRLAPMTP
ncbi:hypothetical protein [Halochromatium sp.]